MTDDEKRIVEWLTDSGLNGLKRRMSVIDRLDIIRRAIFAPKMLVAIILRLAADAIERGDHKNTDGE